jgi:hypothetical protein
MSELINNNDNRATIRWKLLTGASALALTAYVSSVAIARADDTDHPAIWIELGGQLERIGGKEDPFLPRFALLDSSSNVFSPISPARAQKPPIFDFGEEAKITFQPEGSKWNFSAGIRYGRSNNSRNTHKQSYVTTVLPTTKKFLGATAYRKTKEAVFAEFHGRNSESHAIMDFQAGRDVGLGIASTTLDAGIRAVDFSSKSRIGMIARPYAHFYFKASFGKYIASASHTDYMASAYATRSFRGLGPSLSWSGDVPIAGNEDGALTIDWGLNAAMLFGRQTAKGSHKTSANYYTGNKNINFGVPYYDHPPVPHDRARSVTVPDVGGLLGISFRYPGAKVSFGYRADLFFNAMDMGVDARDTKDRAFYGPFASISIGLGD